MKLHQDAELVKKLENFQKTQIIHCIATMY